MKNQPTSGRRNFLAGTSAVALAAVAGWPAPASAQAAYPSKPIRLISPSAPGGVVDTSGRLIAEYLSRKLGQSVVVENRTGAAGNIGIQFVASAEPDGYTLLVAVDSFLVINPHVYDKLLFDTVRDFAPVGKIGDSGLILAAHPSVKAKNLAELIALSKVQPGGLSYGTAGIGTITHVAGELLKQRSGANLTHVPYKGAGPAVADVLGGHLPLVIASAAGIQAHLKSGKLNAIATPSGKRSRQHPDLATFAESGFPNFEVNSWVGIVAPARTPKAILERLNSELNAVLNDSELRDKLAASGISATPGSAQSFGDIIRNELALYGPIVKAAGAGMKPD